MSDRPAQLAFETMSVSSNGAEASTANATIHVSGYRLLTLDVFNWGPFSGRHSIEFDEAGTAIIGPTGSGKTTLVDALMTLLVQAPRYNLASTGGHESDRTLISYVRGVLGGDGSDGVEEVARPGKTITGINATYVRHDLDLQGEASLVRLGGLLWTEGSSNATGDLKRRWIFSTADGQDFEGWLRTLHDDGIRELMKMSRETAGLRVFESKKQYLTHIRQFFDVSENAFTLLNRAAGLKQLNSIDEIFRELVLDDHSEFDRALEVAAEFDNLTAIHAELETARRQLESLLPVQNEEQTRQKLATKTEQFRTLRRITPIWYAMQGVRLWQREHDRLQEELKRSNQQLKDKEREEQQCEALVGTLKEAYLQVGGGLVAQLEETIKLLEANVEVRAKDVQDYLNLIRPFGLSEEITAEALQINQQALRERSVRLTEDRDKQHSITLKAHAREDILREQLQKITGDLRKVKERPDSNLPPKFQDFRDELARTLSLDRENLPFLAELVEVKTDQSAWRGAIERAIGSERLRIFVPAHKMQASLRWVDQRDNRLHVRLQSVSERETRPTFFPDSYAQKLNFRDHPYRSAAEQLIAQRDYHCVDTSDELRQIEHAMTRQGTMSGRRGKFEKQDQRNINEDWMTGFDNRAQLDHLLAQHQQTERELRECGDVLKQEEQRLRDFENRLRAIEQLLSLEFSTIDLPAAKAELESSQSRLRQLLDPNSDASKAKERFDAENTRWKALRETVSDYRGEVRVYEMKRDDCIARIADAKQQCEAGLGEADQQLAEHNVKLPEDIAPQRLDAHQREFLKWVDQQSQKHEAKVNEQRERLIRAMEAAQRADTGELADIGTMIEDVKHYLDRLSVLQTEALPEKQRRFLEYLNRSSDQGVTQLLARIDEEVDSIENRISELNRTLLKVNFRGQRYLQLRPQRFTDAHKRDFDTARRTVRSAMLKDDGGESHFKALRRLVELLREAANNRRTVGARALLDPRYRLRFFVVEVDRTTAHESPRRTGSQSGSGGEKELMASHILTASLSYALCPDEASRPLYASVVLDEAFSKSSPSAATRIIEALRIFGLHPIFVTPNKEIGLLRRHTRKVICVHRTGVRSSVASIRWEELEQRAAAR